MAGLNIASVTHVRALNAEAAFATLAVYDTHVYILFNARSFYYSTCYLLHTIFLHALCCTASAEGFAL